MDEGGSSNDGIVLGGQRYSFTERKGEFVNSSTVLSKSALASVLPARFKIERALIYFLAENSVVLKANQEKAILEILAKRNKRFLGKYLPIEKYFPRRVVLVHSAKLLVSNTYFQVRVGLVINSKGKSEFCPVYIATMKGKKLGKDRWNAAILEHARHGYYSKSVVILF